MLAWCGVINSTRFLKREVNSDNAAVEPGSGPHTRFQIAVLPAKPMSLPYNIEP